MKKCFSFVSMLMVTVCLFSVKVSATAGYENKIYDIYTYNVIEDEALIVNVDSAVSGAVEIPSSIEGYPVTSIGERAFDNCKDITTIKIPAKVRVVEEAAFESCTALTKISVAFGNKSYCAWNGVLFNKARTTLIHYPAGKTDTEYAIPSGVKTVAVSAFSEAVQLKSVTVADTVTTLDEKAFLGCTGLETVVFGNGLQSIASEAFSKCTALAAITIPNSVQDMGYAVFSGCSKLETVTLGRGLNSINGTLFLDCVSLNSIGILSNVKSIASSAFSGCSGLTSITIPVGVTGIGSYAFHGCDNLKTVLYTGSETEKSTITIGSKNESLTAAEWQYNAPSVKLPPEDTPVGYQSDGYVVWRWLSIGGMALVLTAVIVIILVFLIKGVKQRK